MFDPVTRLNAALVGRYRIESELGEGGMATVYLAEDIKHERKVALKVLKPELAAVVGAERFLAEIKTTANLSHPNILPLFDSGEADSFLFYVMPYVEGETLRDKLDRDHQLPVDEAVQIAKNVAEALAFAHSHGVIHRDIKPANILLQAGKPVISDFGIALAVGTAGQGRLTETGLSMGTPHYMSPEQATGDMSVGAATDVYALGCVLYEMLVGEPPYTGSTAQAILGKIIVGKLASATEARTSVPANVDAAIRKALEKVPADRFTGAKEFVRALGDEHFRYGELATGFGATTNGVSSKLAWAGWGFALLIALVSWTLRPTPPPIPAKTMLTIPPPLGYKFVGEQSLALSPDGSRIVFGATGNDGRGQLWLQNMDDLTSAVPLPNTESGERPFWSPDGQTLGFFASGRLWKLDLESRTPTSLCPAPASGGGTWGEAGEIVFASAEELWRVSAEGGDCTIVYPASGAVASWPTILPDGQHFLYSTISPGVGILLGSLAGAAPRTIQSGARDPLFVPPSTIVYGFHEEEFVVPQVRTAELDLQTFSLVGESRVVASGIRGDAGTFSFTVSRNGTLAYLTQPTALPPRAFDRSGKPVGAALDQPIGAWSWDAGNESSTMFVATERRGLFQYDWEAGDTPGPLNRQGILPVSGPGDTLVAFLNWKLGVSGCSVGVLNVVRSQLDTIISGSKCFYPTDWSPDGEELLLADQLGWLPEGEQPPAIWAYSIISDSLRPLVQEPQATNWRGSYSPDGRWIAYASDRTGLFEVWVMPRGGSSRPRQVSRNGGAWPRWGDAGRELYFLSPAGEVMQSQIPGQGLPGTPTTLFTLRDWSGDQYNGGVGTVFDATPDGKRFFISSRLIKPAHLVVILNALR